MSHSTSTQTTSPPTQEDVEKAVMAISGLTFTIRSSEFKINFEKPSGSDPEVDLRGTLFTRQRTDRWTRICEQSTPNVATGEKVLKELICYAYFWANKYRARMGIRDRQ